MYTDPVGSIDDEDVKDMQVQKYKLGEVEFSNPFWSTDFRGERAFRTTGLKSTSIMYESELIKAGATPLIESEEKLKQIEAKELMSVSDHDAIWILSGYLNTAIEAINALQKGVK